MQSIFKAFLLGSIISIFGVLSYWIAPGYDIEENFGLDLLFSVRGQRPPPENTVIIAIDKVASDFYHLPNIPAKWPRELHAELIQYLQSKQAAVIAIDIYFKEAKKIKSDKLLAKAIKNSNNVVLFTHLKREILNQFGATPRTQSAELFSIERLVHPTPIIASAPIALAPFALPKYPAKVSQFWTFRIPAGEIATIPVVTLQLLLIKQTSFLKNLNVLESDNNIEFPFIEESLNIGNFISDMNDWSKLNHSVINIIITKINNGKYDSDFNSEDKLSLLQFFNLYIGSHRRYLNFFGPARSIETFTYDAVLNNRLPNNFSFKNKIVFLGFSERLQPEQLDNFNTIYSKKNGVDLSGVEIAATAFSNLYDLNNIETLDHIAYLTLVAVFGFVVAFIARLLSSISTILVLGVISFSYFGLSVYVFDDFSLWLPIIIPLFLLIPISLFSAISWQYIETNKERNRIRKAFGFYLPDNIVNELATKKQSVQSSRNLMYGICMATDAEQYTALSETLNPKKLSTLVNNYYEVLFKPVRNNKGIISDVVGDAMLAIWTAHNPDLSLRQNACYTSIQIQTELKKLQQNKQSHALETRIGLHSGNIVMGNVGAVDHFEYRAVGDIVNSANRIQGLNKQLQTKIIASLETIRDIPNLCTRELGKFKLAGKSKEINLFEIIEYESNVKNNQKKLLTDFKLALHEFYKGNLNQSLQLFLQINQNIPTDGPSKFYIHYIQLLLTDKDYVKTEWDGIVLITAK